MQCALPRSALGEAAGARCAQHAASNLDNRHAEIVCAASARVNVSVLYQFVDTAKRPWPTGVLAASTLGRIAWGSVAPRKMACRLAREGKHSQRFKAINSRTREGQLGRCPFQSGTGMDAKSRDLALLSFLSVFCAVSAWAGDRDIFGSVFFALGTVAMVGAAYGRRR